MEISQGGLRTAFYRSDAKRLYLKMSSLVTSDSFLKITPGGSVGQLGEVKVKPLSVPASRGKAWGNIRLHMRNSYYD